MTLSNLTPQILPLQDRILTWACSACFHTLALAAVSIASVALREPPQAPTVLSRLEILLSETPGVAEQPSSTATQAQLDATVPQETAAHPEDSLPKTPMLSSSTVRRTVQGVASETPPPPTADTLTTSSDHRPGESPEPTKHPSETSAPATEPDPPAPLDPAESAEQAESTASANAPPEPIAETFADHAESPPQQEDSPSPSTARTPSTSLNDSHTEAAASSAAPPADTVVMNHPVVTQSISVKSQYAWLMELLRRRIVSLQAYPHLARMQGWEGVVVVKTTIDSNGDLLDAVVTKSSGYGALDEDAVRLMHRVCPVHLTRDLGKSRIAVMVPIRYRLDGIAR